MGLSTHILDLQRGTPVSGIALVLARQSDAGWHQVGEGTTDADGRCRTLLGEQALVTGLYRLRFETAPYFARDGQRSLYPFIEITVDVRSPEQHHHIPLLLSANGYTTYRGS